MNCIIHIAKTKALISGYRKADLGLCFRICKNPVFSRRGSYRSVSMMCIADINNKQN